MEKIKLTLKPIKIERISEPIHPVEYVPPQTPSKSVESDESNKMVRMMDIDEPTKPIIKLKPVIKPIIKLKPKEDIKPVVSLRREYKYLLCLSTDELKNLMRPNKKLTKAEKKIKGEHFYNLLGKKRAPGSKHPIYILILGILEERDPIDLRKYLEKLTDNELYILLTPSSKLSKSNKEIKGDHFFNMFYKTRAPGKRHNVYNIIREILKEREKKPAIKLKKFIPPKKDMPLIDNLHPSPISEPNKCPKLHEYLYYDFIGDILTIQWQAYDINKIEPIKNVDGKPDIITDDTPDYINLPVERKYFKSNYKFNLDDFKSGKNRVIPIEPIQDQSEETYIYIYYNTNDLVKLYDDIIKIKYIFAYPLYVNYVCYAMFLNDIHECIKTSPYHTCIYLGYSDMIDNVDDYYTDRFISWIQLLRDKDSKEEQYEEHNPGGQYIAIHSENCIRLCVQNPKDVFLSSIYTPVTMREEFIKLNSAFNFEGYHDTIGFDYSIIKFLESEVLFQNGKNIDRVMNLNRNLWRDEPPAKPHRNYLENDFFPYTINTQDEFLINTLKNYQIYPLLKPDETGEIINCVIFTLLQSQIKEDDKAKIQMDYFKSNNYNAVGINVIKQITKDFNYIGIRVKSSSIKYGKRETNIYLYQNGSQVTSFKNIESLTVVNMGMVNMEHIFFKTHCFLIEPTIFFKLALDNYDELNQHYEDWYKINRFRKVKGVGYYSHESAGVPMDSFDLITYLLDNKNKWLTAMNGNDVIKYIEGVAMMPTLKELKEYYKVCDNNPVFFPYDDDEKEQIKTDTNKEFVKTERKFNIFASDIECDIKKPVHKLHSVGVVGETTKKYLARLEEEDSEKVATEWLYFLLDYAINNKLNDIYVYFHNMGYDIRPLLMHILNIIDKPNKYNSKFLIEQIKDKNTYYEVKIILFLEEENEETEKCKKGKKQHTNKIQIIIRDSYKLIASTLNKGAEDFGMGMHKLPMLHKLRTIENCKNGVSAKQIEQAYLLDGNNKYIQNLGMGDINMTEKDETDFIDEFNKQELKKIMESFEPFYNNETCLYDFAGYDRKYNMVDCEILHELVNKIRHTFKVNMGVDIINHCSISSLAAKYQKNNKCYAGVYGVTGIIEKFISRAKVGGRVCLNTKFVGKFGTKKCQTYYNLVDLDRNSLYPEAYINQGCLKGKPKLLLPDTLKNIFTDCTDFFAEITNIKVNKTRGIPCIYHRTKKGLDWTNEPDPKTVYVVDKQTLTDWIDFHNITYDFIGGLYWDEGRNPTLSELEKKLFKWRNEVKDINPALGVCIKLIMNSCYGKQIEGQHNTSLKLMRIDKFDAYIKKNNRKIKGYSKVAKYYMEVEEYSKKLNQTPRLVHCGVNCLSMSKHLMNKTIYELEDKGINVYYTDTDSMFLEQRHVYGDEDCPKIPSNLMGKGIGQAKNDKAKPYQPPKNGKPEVLARDGLIKQMDIYDVKFYRCVYNDGKTDVTSKGIDTQNFLTVAGNKDFDKIMNNETVKISGTKPSFKYTGLTCTTAGLVRSINNLKVKGLNANKYAVEPITITAN